MPDTRAITEALLSAKLHLAPKLAGDRLFFLSDESGRMSAYSMPLDGGPKTRLIPDDLALPNPKMVGIGAFDVVPALDAVVLAIDDHGDENYRPHLVPMEGGDPLPMWPDRFHGQQVFMGIDGDAAVGLVSVAPRDHATYRAYLADLRTSELTELGSSEFGCFPVGHDDSFSRVAIIDIYTMGDAVLYLWEAGTGERRLLSGVPIGDRDGAAVPHTGFGAAHVRDGGVLIVSTLVEDTGGLVLVPIDGSDPAQVHITGTMHQGVGELELFKHIAGDRYLLGYNIDGVSWGYVAEFDEATIEMSVIEVLYGTGDLAEGVVESASYDKTTETWALAFSSATTPVQLYTVSGGQVRRHTDEAISGLDPKMLSAGEEASYTSHDGTRVSARLYLPAPATGHSGPYPVVLYVHGGPQSQERPDFTWFSMPLIQLFTLRGFAVFVPNVRGSTGYGLAYTKQVDRDWGGADRFDHVAGVEMLRSDDRIDVDRLGVMGRSYGGFMTLTLLGRHPELWTAGVDMFGPYDLFTFIEALPETWKTYMYMAMGHPDRDRELLVERSPKTHIDALDAPLLVIQGRNDPRVVVGESDMLVEDLRSKGKDIEYLVFDDEGHDMVKHHNKVAAYVRIVEFFEEHLTA